MKTWYGKLENELWEQKYYFECEIDEIRREERDLKLQEDFDAKHAERGKELEAAAKADADRKAEREAGGAAGGDVITTVSTDNTSTSFSAESSSVSDEVTLQATRQTQ